MLHRANEGGRARSSALIRASGIAVGLSGLGLAGTGLWARGEVRRMLARERIVNTPGSTPPNAPVTTGGAARSMVEVIRSNTLEAAGGRTYAETDPFIDAAGNPTADEALAIKDEQTGRPVQNPDAALWLQSATLQTALGQAYISSRLADLMVGLGAVFVAAGTGIAAAASRR